MFVFIKKIFYIGSLFLSSLESTASLNCISMKYFYPFSIKTNKCSGSCNNINNPYAKICVP